MSLVGKNRAIFSYHNKNKDGSKFIYKDFEKTKSIHSRFVNAEFVGTSLRAAHMKYCNFTNCKFSGVDFIGTNLRGSNFMGAHFTKCIFVSTVLEKANFRYATFENCYMLGNLLSKSKNVPHDNAGIKIVGDDLKAEAISEELTNVIQSLRENDIIRQSHTLHGKNNKINLLSVLILKETYTEEELIRLLPMIPDYLTTQFYTFSYLETLLTKIKREHTL